MFLNVPLCMVKHWKLWIIEPEGQVKWIFSCPSGSFTVKNSDCIMVLEQGRIIERGTHEQLIEEKGRYYQLYTGNVIGSKAD